MFLKSLPNLFFTYWPAEAAAKYDIIKEHLDKENSKKRNMQKHIQTLDDELNIINRGEMAGHKKTLF